MAVKSLAKWTIQRSYALMARRHRLVPPRWACGFNHASASVGALQDFSLSHHMPREGAHRL
eukprot:scaffold28528_cov24-Tisochrysis_lutea.AAC.1